MKRWIRKIERCAVAEGLRHNVDMRINLDLDECVTVSYAKFGDLAWCRVQACHRRQR